MARITFKQRKKIVLKNFRGQNCLVISPVVILAIFHFSLVQLVSAAGSQSNDFKFTIEPEDVIGIRNEALLMNCTATHGGHKPKIMWQRDEVKLNLAGDLRRHMLSSGALKFENIVHTRTDRPDEGVYQCVANVEGLGTIISRKAKLQIAYLDKSFTKQPDNLSVHLGDTAMFQCLLRGAPKPSVKWYKDDMMLDTDSVNYHQHQDGTLELRSVHFTDFGKYKCEVENIDKSKTSEEALLTQNSDVSTYQGVAPHFILKPESRVALEGSTVELHCAANGRDSEGKPPKISWLKDGVTIDMADLDSRFSMMGQGTLRILNVLEGDEGMYTCRATNLEDAVDTDATITVHVAPRFQRRPADTEASIHTDVMFECDVFGKPDPAITWRKNGEEIINSQYFQVSDSGRKLKILGLMESDQGMYQCFAENQVGNEQASAKLSISETGQDSNGNDNPTADNRSKQGSEELPSEPTYLIVAVESTRFITLTWRPPDHVGSSELLTYTVYWNEEQSQRNRMMNTSLMEANIQGLEPGTKYRVRVLAVNKEGAGPPASIMVQTDNEVNVPSRPANLKCTVLSSTSIVLNWQPPRSPNGALTKYIITYYKDGQDEQEIEVASDVTEYELDDLNAFTKYNFVLTAHNSNGAGIATEEVSQRTYSDVPFQPPQNVTIEAVSSTSLVIRWDPPETDNQNGVITGYKLRYKKIGDRKGNATTVDASQRAFALKDLEKGVTYQVRLIAINVNGSSPPTPWMDSETYKYDLDESVVPGQPVSLTLRPSINSIMVMWIPPSERDIKIRGFVLSYGVGNPYEYKLVLEHNKRLHTIKALTPGTNYVISLRAFNNMGEGRAKLAEARTRKKQDEEPQTPMTPPLGLKALVLSQSTILLTWTDNSLGRNQRITDQRHYTIRYRPVGSNKYKYLNATEVNVYIKNLKPNTEYDFSVKVVKGRRQSTWSLSTVNKTFESAPASAPRNLTPVGVPGHSTWVTLSWQPPRQANGLVTGYVILYTTDSSQRDLEWVVNPVIGGEKLTTTIRDLTTDTKYFFKIQARNNKGMGPVSPTVIYRTPQADGSGGGRVDVPNDHPKYNGGRKELPPDFDVDKYFEEGKTERNQDNSSENGIPPLVLYISIACVGLVTLLAVITVSVFVCLRKGRNNRNSAYKSSNKSLNKPGPKDLKPPDLWIHHEQVELKGMDKNPDNIPMVPEEMKPLNPPDHHSSGERGYDGRDKDRYLRTPVRSSKPIMISVDQPPPPREPIVTALPNGGMILPNNQPSHHHYDNQPHYHNTGDGEQYDHYNDEEEEEDEDDENGSGMVPPSMPLVHPTPIRPIYPRTQYPSQPGLGQQYTSTPRVHGGEANPTQQHTSGKPHPPQHSHPHHHHPPSSPYKKPPTPGNGVVVTTMPPTPVKPTGGGATTPTSTAGSPLPPQSPPNTLHPDSDPDVPKKSFSTEELTAEMANLEGLMKDLNAITQQQFEC